MSVRKDKAHTGEGNDRNNSLKLAIGKPTVFSVLMAVLIVVILYLQAILWLGEGSVSEMLRLKQSIAEVKKENQKLQARNQKLITEVEALRNGLDLIEHRAREDLGLIKKNEVFYHVIDHRELKESAKQRSNSQPPPEHSE